MRMSIVYVPLGSHVMWYEFFEQFSHLYSVHSNSMTQNAKVFMKVEFFWSILNE